jgi:superfamily I DNA and/or RNA helicase
MSDERRLNVMITRPLFSLIIFGDSEVLRADRNWDTVLTEIQSMGCFKRNNNTTNGR